MTKSERLYKAWCVLVDEKDLLNVDEEGMAELWQAMTNAADYLWERYEAEKENEKEY